ncbi:hypothetical protein [Caenimonas aquaedulcis]|uniref:Uncharacterized protein n=1 Tax=Caenimonas aquaedulcis TaxID=2793270 RepID=A0A931H8L6_9BURK|nr:hypothetical protein [Caenimonas aquaedulcis]MBG9390402.1 hypothetical protein [Caenimonas aquaedulcis]
MTAVWRCCYQEFADSIDIDLKGKWAMVNHLRENIGAEETSETRDRFATRRSWVRRIFAYGVVLPLVFYFLMALAVPSNILDQVPALHAFTSGVARFVMTVFPGRDIQTHARSTGFPQAALLCSSGAVVLIPWLIIAAAMGLIIGYPYGRIEKNPFKGMGAAQVIVTGTLLLFGIPIGIWIVQIFFLIPGDPGIYAGVTTMIRFGYAWLSTAVILLSASCIFLQPTYLAFVVDRAFMGGFKAEACRRKARNGSEAEPCAQYRSVG